MRPFGKGIVWLGFGIADAPPHRLTAVLTDPAAKGKDEGHVWGTATFTLQGDEELVFAIVIRSAAITSQKISIHLGTPKQPGPVILVLAEGESPSPIEGCASRGAEIPQPEHGIDDWDDAIDAMRVNRTFLKIESPNCPTAGLAGSIEVN